MKFSNAIALAAMTVMGSAVLSAATACTSEDAAAYEALGAGGCTITVGATTYTFSDFVLTQSAGAGDSGGTATSLMLDPVSVGGVGFDITNNGAWSAAATSVNDDDLSYLITVTGGTISNMYISETGSAGAPTSGDVGGLDTITETLCTSGAIPPSSCGGGEEVTNGGDLKINGDPTAQSGVTVDQTLTYTATNTLSVDKDIQIGAPGGASTGNSSLTEVQNLVNYSAVPEPSSYAFLLVACGALLGIKKYRKGKAEA